MLLLSENLPRSFVLESVVVPYCLGQATSTWRGREQKGKAQAPGSDRPGFESDMAPYHGKHLAQALAPKEAC